MYYAIAAAWILFGTWVFMDAKKRKLKDPFSHAILAYLFGIIGLAVYYFNIVKPNKTDI